MVLCNNSQGCEHLGITQYLYTVHNKIEDLVKKHGHKLDRQDKDSLELIKKKIYNAVNRNNPCDFCICDSGKSFLLGDAIKKARDLLNLRGNNNQRYGDGLIHFVGCNVIVIEEKDIKQANHHKTVRSLDQVRSLFGLYKLLHNNHLVKTWFEKCFGIKINVDDKTFSTDFSKYGGVAIVYISRIDPETKNKLVEGFLVQQKSQHRLYLETDPYIIVVSRLTNTKPTKQLLIAEFT